MRKVTRLTIFILVLIVIIFAVIVYKTTKEQKNVTNSIQKITETENYDDFGSRFGLYNLTEEEKNRIVDWEVNGAHELIRLMCLKNGDWSKLPISKETREQFNEKEGILKDYEFENVEVDYEGVEFYDASPAKIIITNGNEKRRVYIDYRFDDDGINNINIKDVITIVDSEGNKLNEGFPFDDSHIVENFDTWDNVGLTNKYIANHGKELLNLFIHYSPLDYNPITFVENKSELNNHMAYFIVTSVLECKAREYKVYYQLDENNYLDDANAVCVKERELENDKKNRYGSSNAFYKNSNIENDFYSDKFKKILIEKGSYFPDIDLVNINFAGEAKSIKKNESIYCLQMKSGAINSYYIKFIMNDDNQIDDVIVERLPYQSMSAEEVKELYLKEYNSN